MSLAFGLWFLGGLVFQGLTSVHLAKENEGHPLWGFWFMKFACFPLWLALTFASPLGIGMGFALLLCSFILTMLMMIIYVLVLSRTNPALVVDIANDRENAEPTKKIISNQMAFVWGLLLLAGAIVGAF